MSLRRALIIARANLTRLFRDRLGLFFIVVLPLIIILVLGLQFGSGFTARIGVAAPDPGPLGEALIAVLEEDLGVERYASGDAVRDAVEQSRVTAGLVLPDGYDGRLRSGESVAIEFIGASDEVIVGLQRVVAAAIGEQASLVLAARFAAAETGGERDAMLDAAQAVSGSLPGIEVEVAAIGERLFPEGLTGFALGAQSQLILFVFLTSLTGAAQLIVSRQLGVSRRMLATPTTMPTILLGEALGRFAVALFQGVFIVAATALAFGVTWGDPLGAAAVLVAFSLVAAGTAMLIGAVAGNAEQASSVGVFAGLAVAAIGGCMVPPEIFPPIMQTVSRFTPHRWALDGFRDLVGGGSLATILPELGVLLAVAGVLLFLATWRLRAALTR